MHIMKRTELLLLALITVFVLSCSESIEKEVYQDSSIPAMSTDKFVFGAKLDIPYSIDNLMDAYNTLDVKTKSEINIDDIAPTHYYVRFAPLDGEDLDILLNDKQLVLYEFPMDVEILEFGSSYHDPTLPLDQPTYQYSVVDVNYWNTLIEKIDFDYEVLMSVFMPEESDYYIESKSKILSNSAYEILLNTAYRNAGQVLMPETKSSWTPSGYIKTYDNIVQGYVPVKGVRVRGKHLLKTVEALTDTCGYFSFSKSFSNTPNMMIVWESDEWDIREGTTGQAYLSKPCTFGQPWNVNITATDGDGVYFAAIHRACYRTFYGYNYFIAPPNYSRKIKLGYVDEINNGSKAGLFLAPNYLGAGLDIKIAASTTSTPSFTISQIFSTTSHELGHALYYTSTHASNYSISEERMIESWAVFIQYLYTRREYAELGVENNLVPNKSWHSGMLFENADLWYNYQKRFWTNDPDEYSIFERYTPVYIDLFDDYNQLIYYDNLLNTIHPDDNIHGLSPFTIRQFAFTNISFSGLKAELVQYANNYPSNPFGITEENVNKLFNVYDDV